MESYCRKAVAYLKSELDDGGEPALALSKSETPVSQPLGNKLLALFVVDTGDTFEYVNYGDIERSGISADELYRIGVGNLVEIARTRLEVHPHQNIFALIAGGNFEASLLLLTPLWTKSLAKYVDGEFLVALPARDILAFGDSSNPQTVPELRAVIERVWTSGDHLLSRDILRFTGSRWEIRATDQGL